MMDEASDADLTLDLYIRSLAQRGTQTGQDAVITRLEGLDEQGVIAEFTVHVWGERVAFDTATARTNAGKEVMERVEAFRAWADQSGISVKSFFDAEKTQSTITDEEYTIITLPTITLVEYVGDSLRFVAPCTDGETFYSVADRLDALERGETAVPHDG